MEIYLDSVSLDEIKQVMQLWFIKWLTTTPTFMKREWIKDVDKSIVEISTLVPELHIEALGKTHQEIIAETKRQESLWLDKETTVYKIPITLEWVKACHQLTQEGYKVNMHLIYTLQQACMAMQAWATYICPLVWRLQDQWQNALELVKNCIDMKNYYNSPSKIMFSSVRTHEHIKNAIQLWVDCITLPGKLLNKMPENHFTEIGIMTFEKDIKDMNNQL